jgi:hypothetical protein
MNRAYLDAVRLLLAVAPSIFRQAGFALIVSRDTIKGPSRHFPSHLKFYASVWLLNGGTCEDRQGVWASRPHLHLPHSPGPARLLIIALFLKERRYRIADANEPPNQSLTRRSRSELRREAPPRER